MTGRVHFAIPGDLSTPTGGYGYDRRVIAELPGQGWAVRHLAVPGANWPFPTDEERATAAAALAALPDGAVVLGDALAFSVLPDLLEAEAARLRLVALVHHPLGDETGLREDQRATLIAAETRALRHVREIVVTSPATGRRLASAFDVAEARITVAPPGTARGARAARVGDPPLILSIGSLIPRKRHDVLIDALASLADLRWRAHIIGSAALDPACAEVLARRIADCGMEERIVLTGAVADTRAALDAADIFVLASEYEGYGMAFAEALSHGLPIVACRAGAIADLVPEDAGALVPPGDAAALAEALAGLLDDPAAADRAAEVAWAAGQALPTWEETATRIATALDRAAA